LVLRQNDNIIKIESYVITLPKMEKYSNNIEVDIEYSSFQYS